MQAIIHRYLNMFLYVVAATSALTIGGVIYVWFVSPERTLPYLGWLLTISVGEIIGIALAFVKTGIKYLPKVYKNKTDKETAEFMADFIRSGTSVTIVSNRLGWAIGAPNFISVVEEKASQGTSFEFITAKPVARDLEARLRAAGATLIVTNEQQPPEARFTIINAHRSGAERLAIARGTHPEHEITVFDNDSGPQMIGMAKDIIRKSKERQSAKSLV